MHMNVWDYCINKVRAEIPNEILTQVFSVKNNTFDNGPGIVSIDERIKQLVFYNQMLVDYQLIGSTEITIAVDSRYMETPYTDDRIYPYIQVYRIPTAVTQNKIIVTVKNFTIGSPWTPTMPFGSMNYEPSALARSSKALLESHGTIPISKTAYTELVGPNTILLRSVNIMPVVSYFVVVLAADDQLSNITAPNMDMISEHAILGVKRYIYVNRIIAMGNAEIRGGYDLGVFKSTIGEYSDASELYKTMLKEKIKKIFFMNDRTRFANHLRSMIIPKL